MGSLSRRRNSPFTCSMGRIDGLRAAPFAPRSFRPSFAFLCHGFLWSSGHHRVANRPTFFSTIDLFLSFGLSFPFPSTWRPALARQHPRRHRGACQGSSWCIFLFFFQWERTPRPTHRLHLASWCGGRSDVAGFNVVGSPTLVASVLDVVGDRTTRRHERARQTRRASRRKVCVRERGRVETTVHVGHGGPSPAASTVLALELGRRTSATCS